METGIFPISESVILSDPKERPELLSKVNEIYLTVPRVL
jgi:hypothetical protein